MIWVTTIWPKYTADKKYFNGCKNFKTVFIWIITLFFSKIKTCKHAYLQKYLCNEAILRENTNCEISFLSLV